MQIKKILGGLFCIISSIFMFSCHPGVWSCPSDFNIGIIGSSKQSKDKTVLVFSWNGIPEATSYKIYKKESKTVYKDGAYDTEVTNSLYEEVSSATYLIKKDFSWDKDFDTTYYLAGSAGGKDSLAVRCDLNKSQYYGKLKYNFSKNAFEWTKVPTLDNYLIAATNKAVSEVADVYTSVPQTSDKCSFSTDCYANLDLSTKYAVYVCVEEKDKNQYMRMTDWYSGKDLYATANGNSESQFAESGTEQKLSTELKILSYKNQADFSLTFGHSCSLNNVTSTKIYAAYTEGLTAGNSENLNWNEIKTLDNANSNFTVLLNELSGIPADKDITLYFKAAVKVGVNNYQSTEYNSEIVKFTLPKKAMVWPGSYVYNNAGPYYLLRTDTSKFTMYSFSMKESSEKKYIKLQTGGDLVECKNGQEYTVSLDLMTASDKTLYFTFFDKNQTIISVMTVSSYVKRLSIPAVTDLTSHSYILGSSPVITLKWTGVDYAKYKVYAAHVLNSYSAGFTDAALSNNNEWIYIGETSSNTYDIDFSETTSLLNSWQQMKTLLKNGYLCFKLVAYNDKYDITGSTSSIFTMEIPYQTVDYNCTYTLDHFIKDGLTLYVFQVGQKSFKFYWNDSNKYNLFYGTYGAGGYITNSTYPSGTVYSLEYNWYNKIDWCLRQGDIVISNYVNVTQRN